MAFRSDPPFAAALMLLLLLLFNFITLPANAKAHSFGPNNRRRHHHPAAAKIRHFPVPPPPPATPWRHHVFLNFRGLEIRHTFSDHLYYALVRRGVKAFRDDHDLPRGENITEAIPRAIEESRMSIVVLSRGYASSEWCLDELVKIMEAAKDKRAHHQTFPVFYKVSPDEVSDQSSGCYKEDFDLHKRKFSYERVDNWRHALTSIADVSGWEIAPNGHRSEAEMVETIANSIVLKVHQLARFKSESKSNQSERPAFVPAFRAPEGALDDDDEQPSSSSDDITIEQKQEEETSKHDQDDEDDDSDYKRRLWMSRICMDRSSTNCNNNNNSSSSSSSNNNSNNNNNNNNNKNDHTRRDQEDDEQKLKYIKPTISPDGEKTVRIPKTIAEEEIKKYRDHSVVAQQLSGRQNITIILNEANRIWSNKIVAVEEVATTRNKGLSSYIFTFSSQDLRHLVVEASPWCIANATFVMRKWQPNVQLSDLLDRSTIPVWVRLVGVPVEYMTAKGLSYVASALGKPVYMDRATANRTQLAFAKVCVEMKVRREGNLTSTIAVAIGGEEEEEDNNEGEVVVVVVRVFYQWRTCMCCIINPSHKATTKTCSS